ncbi:vWA domain-containing protein [Streptomyces albipurpureus]|uniref:VWA domain-containing protein n=1 Tax=Streptomyces albipurpureus TaxID=2897419 RepID=A0ABT0UFZ2_9ACTN|nr:vWA domain-containing protein [Streptomyces sp. CWNU-1]MCM2387552.1 VWA domain-containing protein [Streptomyces sp. CWNU-1]
MSGRGEMPDQALLIGVSRYEYHLAKNQNFGLPGDIPAARTNVELMKSAFQGIDLFPDAALRVCDHTHSEEQVLAELKAAANLARGLLLFYYCGHAMPHLRGEELWLPLYRGHAVRGEDSIDYANSIRLSRVLERLGRSRAQRVVVVLDCCYAGTAEALLARLPDARRRKFTLLLGVQSNRRVDAGTSGTPTPYTRELAALLSAGHRDTRDLAQRIAGIAAEQKWTTYEGSARETVHVAGDPVAAARLEPTASVPERGLRERLSPLRRASADRLRGVFVWLRAHLIVVAVVLAGLGGGSYALYRAIADQPFSCVPAQEIRLLTDPELEETVRAAADTFEGTPANKDADGCLLGGVTVYSAPADQVVQAFRKDAAAWQDPTEEADPGRDIGPQPDVWIPATSAEPRRAEPVDGGASPAELSDRPVALPVSPIVLAVPEAVATKAGLSAGPSGRTLGELLTVLHGVEADSVVRRTDPEAAATGLLATQGLYTGLDSVEERKRAERRISDGQRPPATTGEKLLCELPQSTSGGASALVPAFRLKKGVDCGRPETVHRIAVEPNGMPGLDPVFVQVQWTRADNPFTTTRQKILKEFKLWLTGPEGRDQFTRLGFESGGIDRASAAGLDAVLAEYRKATGPGRVLFLVDTSLSMSSHWEGDGGALGLLRASFKGLGVKDEYEVWSVASKDGAQRPYSTVLSMGSHRPEAARKALDAKAQLRRGLEADPYRALGRAVDTMATYGQDDDRPQLIVFLTDDEDGRRPGWQQQLDDLTDETREQGIPVVIAVFARGACADGTPDRRVTDAAGGRCLDPDAPGTLMKDLATEVAWVGMGEEQ